MVSPAEPSPVLLYDGGCGFCVWNVQMLLRRDRRRTLLFASLQGRFAAGVRARHPELAGLDSVVWVEPASAVSVERVYVRSSAVLRAARYLGGLWQVALLAYGFPPLLRDRAYDVLAGHRHHLTGADRCSHVDVADRARFLD